MSQTRFIFKIGPVPASDGEATAYFVMPPENGSSAYLAADDRSGLTQILQDYAAATLECEPELAAAALEFGIQPGEIDAQRAHLIGGMAFDMALGDYLNGVEREEAVYTFAAACNTFWQAAPWRYRFPGRLVEIVLSGALNDTLTAIVLGGGAGYGLSLYQDRESAGLLAEMAQQGRLEEAARADSLIVTFNGEPAFAADAMRRAYGMPRIPIATKMQGCQGVPLSDLDLMALAAALKAVSILTDEIPESSANIVAGDLELEAVARIGPAS